MTPPAVGALAPALPTSAAALPVVAVRGRPTGRGRPRGALLHAVPSSDRTRTALCGARVGGAARPWPPGPAGCGTDARGCPDCVELLPGWTARAVPAPGSPRA